MAVVVAYDIYRECAEGRLEGLADCKLAKTVSFHRFREKLAKQMLKYDPRHRNYPGDEYFRVSTQQRIRDRTPPRSRSRSPANGSGNRTVISSSSSVTSQQIKTADQRLCGDLTKITEHGLSLVKLPKRAHKVCVVCGKNCYHKCKKCGVALHKPPSGEGEKACFYHWHNALFYGLAKSDYKMAGTKRKDYEFPTAEVIAEHANGIKKLREQGPIIAEDGDNAEEDSVSEMEGSVVADSAQVGDVYVRNGQELGII